MITLGPPEATVCPQRGEGACPGSFNWVHPGGSFSSFHNKYQATMKSIKHTRGSLETPIIQRVQIEKSNNVLWHSRKTTSWG